MQNNPIGIFDSGVGGLSVWEEIVSLLPEESTIYIGDQKNIPYGEKSPEELYVLTKRLIQFLLEKHVKLIVIACNAATVSCLERLRSDFRNIPIIGTVPVIKTAAQISKNKKIGVLSTVRTAESHYQQHLIEEFAQDCQVTNIGTNELVPRIERGDINSNQFKQILQKVLLPLQKADVDTVALGCTHFPFIEKQISEILGIDVQLLDSGAAIARQVKRVLEHNQTLTIHAKPTYTFYTTGDKKQFATTAKKLVQKELHDKIKKIEKIRI